MFTFLSLLTNIKKYFANFTKYRVSKKFYIILKAIILKTTKSCSMKLNSLLKAIILKSFFKSNYLENY